MKKIVLAAAVLTALGLSAGAILAAETAAPAKAKAPGWRFIRHAEKTGLNLSDEQKEKIRAICKEARGKVKVVLTADQLKKLQDARGKGLKARREARKEVRASLTAEQKASIREIRRNAWKGIREVLTDDQRAALRKAWQEHHKGPPAKPAKPAQ